MIFKKFNSLKQVTLLLATLLFGTACQKDQDLIRDRKQIDSPATKLAERSETKLYQASSAFTSSWIEDQILELDKDKTESARTIIQSPGYSKALLNASSTEFKEHNIKGHFAVLGNTTYFATTANLDQRPTETTKPTSNALFISPRNGASSTAMIDMYCFLPETLQRNNTLVCFALGGKQKDNGSLIDFTSETGTSPNKSLKMLKAGEEDKGRQIPVMTEFGSFDDAFSEKGKQDLSYKPRGVLIGFNFSNYLSEEITIKKLVFPEDNALFFEGSFDLSKSEDGSAPTKGTKAQFIGVNKAFTFDLKPEGAKLPSEPMADYMSRKVRERTPLVYVWGYPNHEAKSLKIGIVYVKNGKEKTSNTLELPLPKGGFKDGSTIRIPLPFGKKIASRELFAPSNKPMEASGTIRTINAYQALPNYRDYLVRPLINTNKKYSYRVALAVSKTIFEKFFNSSKEEVRQYWTEAERFLNRAYNRDLGIYITIIKDDKLILENEDPLHITSIDEYPNGRSLYAYKPTQKMNNLIGENNYDIGGWLTPLGGSSDGYAALGGAYLAARRADLVVRNRGFSVLGHEFGHLLGARHTLISDPKYSLQIENGYGQSFMGGNASDFFNTASVADIFTHLNHYPYAVNREKTEIIDPYSLSVYNNLRTVDKLKERYNIVYAETVSTEAPHIDRNKFIKEYRVPTGSFYTIDIPVENANEDMFYTAASITRKDGSFYIQKGTNKGQVDMQTVYSRAGGSELASEPVKNGGTHRLRVAVSSFNKQTHPVPQYDSEEITVTFVEVQKAFTMRSDLGQGKVLAGYKTKLEWNVDNSFFDSNSKVRITMSADYGKTYPYVLAEEVPNNGSCDIALPYIEVLNKVEAGYEAPVNPCIIKIQVLDSPVYALSNYNPRRFGQWAGGFLLSKALTFENVTFENCPEPVLNLSSQSKVPEASSYHIVAKQKNGRYGTKEVTPKYTETQIRTLSDGRQYIMREWSVPSPSASWKSYAFRQHIYIK